MTATCTGTTENSNGANGYGTGSELGAIVTVAPGATVTGDQYGVILGHGSEVSTGADSRVEGEEAGIYVEGQGAVVDIAGSVASDWFGVAIGGGTVTLASGATITVSNADLQDDDIAAGIMVDDDGHVTVNGALTTSGRLVQGVLVERQTPSSMRSTSITVGQNGSITTDGDFASAVVLFGGEQSAAWHSVTTNGRITTTGDHAYGIDAREVIDDDAAIRSDTTIVMNGVLRTSGAGAHGVFSSVSEGSVSPITISNDLRVTGDDAHGVLLGIARGGAGQITVASGGTVTAEGQNGIGIALSPSGEIPGLGTANILIAEGGYVSAVDGPAIGWVDDPFLPADPAVGRIDTHLTIAGTVAAASREDTAVRLGAGDDRLTLLPTYDVTGVVSGGDGFDTFVLDGAAGTVGETELFLANTARVTGFEDIRKVGEGTWHINGTVPSSLVLPAGTVEAGTLMLNAATAGLDLTVLSGATLGGRGTLGALDVADGGILAPGNSAGTLTMDSLVLNNGSVLNFELGAPGVASASDRIDVAGHLTLDGILNVIDAGGFGNGVYTLINYGTLIADNGLALGTTPGGYGYNIDAGTGTASAVTLEVTGGSGGTNQYWDGTNTTPGGTQYGRGGAGVWNAANTNWTNAGGSANAVASDAFAVFYNGTGDVTVEGAQSVIGLQFASNGYRLVAGASGSLNLTGGESTLRVDAGHTATLALPVTVAGDLTRQGAGTLNLVDNVSIAGRLRAAQGATRVIEGGQLAVNSGASIGEGTGNTVSLAITGGGSEIHVSGGGLQAGFSGGTGEIIVSDGGHLRVDGRYDLQIIPGGGPLGEDLTRIIPINEFVLGKNGGAARLEVNGGGAVTAGVMIVGEFSSDDSAAATADVILDGAGSTIALTENLQLNLGGTFTVSGGAQLQTFTDSSVASNADRSVIAPDRVGWSNTRSTMTVTGAGSNWTSGNVIRIEQAGTLFVVDNAAVSVADSVVVGRSRVTGIDGPSAILNVDNARLQMGGALDIANGGSWAEVNFTNGAIIETAGLMAGTGGTTSGGVSYTAQADILVAGAGTRWTDTAAAGIGFSLGDTGVTTLTIADGAVMETANQTTLGTREGRADIIVSGGGLFLTPAAIMLGESTNGTGTLTITGTGSRVATGDTLDIGGAGRGEVTVADNGLLIASHIHVGRSGGSGLLTIGADGWANAGGLDLLAGEVRLGTGGTLTLSGIGTIGAAGRLAGTGLVEGDLMVNAGGTIAPGNSIGTLTVVGDITFNAGSIFEVEVNAAGEADHLHTFGAVTIDGGEVQVLAGMGDYAPATTYTILTGEDGRSGEFASVTSNLAFLDPSLSYDASNVYLTMTRNAVTFDNVGITPNQIAAGSGTESLGSGNGAFDAVLDLSADQARAAFDRLSGEIHASARTTMLEGSRFVRNAVWDRLRGVADDDRGGAWGQALGSWGHTNGDGNAARLDRSTGGLLMGADGAVGDNLRLGAVWGYSRTDIDVDARGSSGKIDSYHLGAYAGGQWGAAAIRTGIAYSWNDIHTTRGIGFTGFSDTTRAGYDGGTFQAFGELGYGIDLGRSRIEPFANIAYVRARSDAFRETGGDAALTGAKATTDVTFSTLGLRTATGLDLGKAQAIFRAGAGWRHAFGNTTPITTMRFLGGGDAFTIAGLPVTRNAATVDAGLEVAISGKASLGISYSGQFGDGLADQTGRASLIFKF